MKEHGICAKCKKSVGCSYADERIMGCRNFVLEPELQLINEEWLRQANTEELAGAIYEWHTKGYTKGRLELELNPITEIVEWLKQPHKDTK